MVSICVVVGEWSACLYDCMFFGGGTIGRAVVLENASAFSRIQSTCYFTVKLFDESVIVTPFVDV
jgi:hypothetical protein